MNDVRLAALRAPGDPDAWRSLGFTVDDHTVALANGAIRLGSPEWAFELEAPGREADTVDGIPVVTGAGERWVRHPNGAVEIDHVVVMTDSIERTSASIDASLGLRQRRIRETEVVRQAFHRFADTPDGTRGCIVEVVERPDVERVDIWGLVVIVDDLDRAVAESNGLIGAPKSAVQPGRRIATVSRSAGLPVALALMSR
jgi:catechol 2,3-dioxygenase-like lactoylglutathione lyase family enzyme